MGIWTFGSVCAYRSWLNYYERARRSIVEADEAELAVFEPHWQGPHCCCSRFRAHSPDAALTGISRHPDLEIEVLLDDRDVDLVQEGVDVALRMTAS